ncbi:MAG TPA: hypothetical protein VGD54_18675 [Steroidobacteraceae bacterium]
MHARRCLGLAHPSCNLYGERDYAKHIVMFDDAVGDRCRSGGYSIFDERKLTARARAVLGSLEIDTELADTRA